ncbi:MAG: hypothetical protein KKD59_09300 [Acidobacteria bacterium]|nr:hypothetical protein [Acidobacteriota bacterium]
MGDTAKIQKRLASPIFIIIFFLFLTFIFYSGLFLDFSTKIPDGDHNDVKNILTIISHSIHAPLSRIYHLPVLYPESYMLARTHPLFGVSVIFKIFSFFGLSLVQSCNLYIIFALVTGAVGCFLLARELSGHTLLSLFTSSLYIIHQKNTLFFVWLNFLSLFYMPFIFYLLIRFARTKKRGHLWGAAFLCFLQFLASIYYGVHLWVILLPAFVGAALLLKLILPREMESAVLAFAAAFLLILFVFYPFMAQTQSGLSGAGEQELVNVPDLFHYTKLSHLFTPKPDTPAWMYFFPGFTFLFLLLYVPVAHINRIHLRRILFCTMAALTVLISVLFYRQPLIAEILFLMFLAAVVYSLARGWKNMDPPVRAVTFTFGVFFLTLFRFTHIPLLRSISLYDVLNRFLPLEGLRDVQRVFFMGLPLVIALAAVGGAVFLRSRPSFSLRKQGVLLFVLLILMGAENIRFVKQRDMMQPLERIDPAAYEKISADPNVVLLEIPFYFDKPDKNAIYSLNWNIHRASLLNGTCSVPPKSFDLLSVIDFHQLEFPSDAKLRLLLEKFSVTHVLIHWDRLETYNPDSAAAMRTNIHTIGDFGRIVSDGRDHTLLEVGERVPVRRIIRTYSQYDLRDKPIAVRLDHSYEGNVNIFLNHHLVQSGRLSGTEFSIDLRTWPLSASGNRVEIHFQNPVSVSSVGPRQKSSPSAILVE